MKKQLILKAIARKHLIKNAKAGNCITYLDFANALKINTPPVIAAVTKLLEVIIEEDVVNGHPILSSIVIRKGSPSLPGSGFFEKLHSLGVINLNETHFSEKQWHANELLKLKKL